MLPTTKRCAKCGLIKQTSEFGFVASCNYFRSRCNVCLAADAMLRRQKRTGRKPRPPKQLILLIGDGEKLCRICGRIKPVSEFYRRLDGLAHKCKECMNAYGRAHYQRNRTEYIERAAEWADKNPKRAQAIKNAGNKRHRAAHPEYWREKTRQYRKSHPDVHCEQEHRRRARKRSAPHIERVFRAAVIARDNGVCYLCGRQPQGYDLTLDHVIPLVRGGSHTMDNLRVACRSCNSKKGTKLLEELE